jgi:hypothetical protein
MKLWNFTFSLFQKGLTRRNYHWCEGDDDVVSNNWRYLENLKGKRRRMGDTLPKRTSAFLETVSVSSRTTFNLSFLELTCPAKRVFPLIVCLVGTKESNAIEKRGSLNCHSKADFDWHYLLWHHLFNDKWEWEWNPFWWTWNNEEWRFSFLPLISHPLIHLLLSFQRYFHSYESSLTWLKSESIVENTKVTMKEGKTRIDIQYSWQSIVRHSFISKSQGLLNRKDWGRKIFSRVKVSSYIRR